MMDFIWNDGGRAACGFVGFAGDCVTRAIAIATGTVYREVYEQLGEKSEKSPRNGVDTRFATNYLKELGWQHNAGCEREFAVGDLPKGIVIVHLAHAHDRGGHFCTLIDHVVHDTWNPTEDENYLLINYWTPQTAPSDGTLPAIGPKHRISDAQQLTQSEFDKILNRLRALDRTASNGASTEGEKHNALRMMQNLMLRHNLSREDIVDDDNVENVLFTRVACPVNGRRSCSWEKMLATYVSLHIFPTTQWFSSTRGHRTLFWFYGPKLDVENTIALFRELLLTIATAAYLQFGGHTRGSGASYAEGYVRGLPRATSQDSKPSTATVSSGSLMLVRTLAIHNAAKQWLDLECNIQLVSSKGAGRYQRDPAAESRGVLHGSKHEITTPNTPRRIAQQ